jgi:hypothetical protein
VPPAVWPDAAAYDAEVLRLIARGAALDERSVDDRGTGAGRQRTLFTSAASTPAFITALAGATLSGYEPGRWRRPDARLLAAPGAAPVTARQELK